MTNKEKYNYLKLNFDITENEFRNFLLLGGKAERKIQRLRESDLVLTPPPFVSVNVERLRTREDFEKRVGKFENILSPDFRTEYNEKIEQKFYDFIYDISDGDISQIERIYRKWKRMTVRQKKEFFDKNYDIRRVVYYKDEYDEELNDLIGNDYEKLMGRLEEYD